MRDQRPGNPRATRTERVARETGSGVSLAVPDDRERSAENASPRRGQPELIRLPSRSFPMPAVRGRVAGDSERLGPVSRLWRAWTAGG
jgi:hypothetical protein